MQDKIRAGAICFMLTALFFPVQFVSQLFSPGYDIFLYDISLLGISSCQVHPVAASGSTDPICSPLYHLFNFGIILHGALAIGGIWLTRHLWPTGASASAGLTLLALGGVGAMMVGAYPLDGNMLLHIVGAVMAIALPGLGLLLLARPLQRQQPSLAYWSLFAGVIILLAGLGHALGGQPFGRGTMERLAVWPQTLWYLGVGMMLLSPHHARTFRKPALA